MRAAVSTIGRDARARAPARLEAAGVLRRCKPRSIAPRSANATSSAANITLSMPGATGRNRSASSAVAVRRGSMTTIFAPRSRAVLQHALEQNRMAPGGVRADEHDQIGLIEILIDSRHGVGAESARWPGDRRRHAEPRIGVDIGRADEALHQLVGDVIILGQQLAREIERDARPGRAFDDVARIPPRRASSASSQSTRA